MFFGEGRIPIVQRMILADNEADRRKALDELLPLQRDDFYGVFKAMHGTPVTIRTIDPPLHEFLPKREDLMVEIARLESAGQDGQGARREEDAAARASSSCTSSTRCSAIAASVSASPIPRSPRCRRARSSRRPASCNKEGLKVVPEIMIPLVGAREGAARSEGDRRSRRRRDVMKEQGVKVKYLVGTMIEVPRGAMTADEIAAGGAVLLVRHQRPHAADLRLLARRRRQVPADLPGQEDPRQGSVRVDRRRRRRRSWSRSASRRGRKTRPDLKLGICGEHGGDPASIHFFDKVGLDYVSARRIACRSRGWPPRRRRCRSRSATDSLLRPQRRSNGTLRPPRPLLRQGYGGQAGSIGRRCCGVGGCARRD